MKGISAYVVLALVLAGLPASVQAQAFPTGPISVVVPLAPGDAADTAARVMSEEISRLLNVSVVAINRPGAGGAVGANSVVQARKDGHTILFAQNSALTFRAVLDPQAVPYDALRDLVPLGIASRTPSVLVVRGDAPYRTFSELIEYAKSIAALRGEHIEGVVSALGALSTHLKAGTFRGVVTSSRVPELSDLPTLRELGYQEDLFGIWFSFLAPAGISEEARKVLVGAIEQAVKLPAIATRFAPLGIFQSYSGPEQAAAEMREELRRVSAVARRTGLSK